MACVLTVSREEHSALAALAVKSRQDAETQRNHSILRNRKRKHSLLQARLNKYYTASPEHGTDIESLLVHTPHRRVPEWTTNLSHRRSGPSSMKRLAQRARYQAGAASRALKDRLSHMNIPDRSIGRGLLFDKFTEFPAEQAEGSI